MLTLKSKGYAGEELVKHYYLDKGYSLIAQNRTFPGGEIDLIMKKDEKIIFVEVKRIDTIKERENYITPKKLNMLERSIDTYSQKYSITNEISLDIVFVQGDTILEHYENITNQ